jgi:signal transduction histidine kinase
MDEGPGKRGNDGAARTEAADGHAAADAAGRALLERLPDGMVAVDADLRTLFANPAARRILGPRLRQGRRIPRRWGSLALHDLVRKLSDDHAEEVEQLVTAPNGRTYSVRAIPDPRAKGVAIVLVDVSARARRDRAEREFVANAAHELRTPLASIMSAIEVLQAGAKNAPPERDQFLAHIERECGRLARLAAALLKLARAETGVEPPRVEVVELCALLGDVARELRPAEGVSVEVACPADLIALANRDLLEQALVSLADNAAKHTSAGKVRLSAIHLDDEHTSIEVADTGVGMSAEERERAVERFHRGPEGAGFGLGLAIATQCLQAIGATLSLESEPGRGTTARVTLPSGKLIQR